MTLTRSSADIREELAENTKALLASREDAALFERLKNAAGEFAKRERRDGELRAELLKAGELEALAKKEAAYANIRNMRVETRHGRGGQSSSPIAPVYIIRFDRLAYNSSTRRSEWTAAEVNGFAALNPEQFGYLVEVATDQIPAGIKALAPGNPVEAFRIYSLGMSRGHLRG